MNILVTGGAGYIGSHCAKLLKQNGFHPIVIDNFSRGHQALVKYGSSIVGDCRDISLLRSVLSEYQITSVFHLAGYAYVEESTQRPFEYYSNNVGGVLALLEAMSLEGVDTLVFSSSCTVYGNRSTPALEDSELVPLTPYAKSKAICEKIIQETAAQSGIRSVVLRYFNVAGADPDGEIGELHEPETHILPLMIRTALGKKSQFTIFGQDYPTPDGTCIRDYVHVSDVADAHLRALTHLKNGGSGRVYNLSSQEGISNLQLARAVEKFTGRSLNLTFGPRRAGDEAVLVGDSSRIRQELGWTSQFSSLETMVTTALNWELKLSKLPLHHQDAAQHFV